MKLKVENYKAFSKPSFSSWVVQLNNNNRWTENSYGLLFERARRYVMKLSDRWLTQHMEVSRNSLPRDILETSWMSSKMTWVLLQSRTPQLLVSSMVYMWCNSRSAPEIHCANLFENTFPICCGSQLELGWWSGWTDDYDSCCVLLFFSP